MITSNNNCQQLVTHLQSDITQFIERLRTTGSPSTTQLNVFKELPLVAAYWPIDQRLVLVIDDTNTRCVDLAKLLAAWQQFIGVNRAWQVITAELTEQEISGEVFSHLSQTIQAFITPSYTSGFIIPTSQLGAAVPDPASYAASGITITVGERHSVGEFIRQAVTHGYVRYTTTLAAGGIRVRGETVDIMLPNQTSYVSIAWHGTAIESIIEHSGQRSRQLHHTNLPALSFPTSTVPLTTVLTDCTVLHPVHVVLPGTTASITYDAIRPTVPFPLRTPVRDDLPVDNLYVLYENRDRVADYLRDHHLTPTMCQHELGGFDMLIAGSDYALATETALFPATLRQQQALSYQAGLALLGDLTVGKPAVHSDHGIGMYEGLEEHTIGEQTREYLHVRYAAGDRLLVPVEFAHKVTPYIGEATPPIQRLGGAGWVKAKRQAQHDAAAFAKELLTIASQRTASPGHAHVIDPTIEQTLNDTFTFELTPDQEQAWADVQRDLATPEPMDRLLVGDVGFGKTEIAIRAARHVVATNRQVAILAPTTLLVQQHADTFRTRFPDLADRIVVMSRFAKQKELRTMRESLAHGESLIAIGTHALLSKATTWHDLGLLVIDEEQRFGVSHKEHFKRLRPTVDVLSLSATPIPRTLSMALSGLKQLSIISSPPPGRKDVHTVVGHDTDTILAQALNQELSRGGQVYVIAPKIRQLGSLLRRITQLAPNATAAVIHGRLAPADIAKTMAAFDTGTLSILVSSTIIENGIDLPNANTIVVTHATHFGLADLYQLRGRVGRRQRQGRAYFLYNQTTMTTQQRQRLAALLETTRLGSGWLLAQRDLEMRGAGNLLGAQQSGTVNAVGVQLYLDLVREAVTINTSPVNRHDIEVQLPLIASLPPHYIADGNHRTQLYQQLSRATDVKHVTEVAQSITNSYGPLPVEARNLVLLIRLQHAAAKAGITRIESLVVAPPDEDPYERLIIHSQMLPQLIPKLSSLGRWEVKDTTLQLGVNAITETLVNKLITVLE